MNVCTASDRKAFVNSYIAALLWTGVAVDESGEVTELDSLGYDHGELWEMIDTGTRASIMRDALAFMRSICTEVTDSEWEQYVAATERLTQGDSNSWGAAGHDFALTRNHHGAGFWDRGAGEAGRVLSDMAQAEGECEIMADSVSGVLVHVGI